VIGTLESATVSPRAMLLSLLLVFVAGLFPFAGTFFQHYPDERNYTNAAITMVNTRDYLTPRWPDGRPNLHKPIVAYWLVAASYSVFGITLPASRLPFMVAGALVVALAYATAFRLTGRGDTALLAAVITSSEPQLILSSMRAIPDVLLCLFTLLSAYGFLGLIVPGRPPASAYWAAYVGAALAIETKGLLALVFVAFVWVFAWLDRGEEPASSRLRALIHGPSMLVALLVATAWYAAMYWLHRDRLIRIFFGDQISYNVQVFDGTPLLRVPTYLAFLVINLLPWSLLLIPLALYDRPSFATADASRRRAKRFIVLWSLLMAIIFGLGNKIEPRYLLPAGPLLAILLADQLTRADAAVTWRAFRYLLIALLVLLAGFGLVLSLLDASVIGMSPALLTLALVGAVIATIALAARGGALSIPIGIALSVLLAFSLTVITLGPALEPDAGVKAIARELERTQRDGAQPVLVAGPEFLANKLRVTTAGRIAIDSWSRLGPRPDAWPARMIVPAAEAAALDLMGYRRHEVAAEVRSVPVAGLLRAIAGGRVKEFLDARRERYVIAIRR
jgi:4-amino-4-deoxy-L-arabinose transferase-like glycosyltransferase